MKLFNKKLDAKKVWVTSDWHLNHKNICKSTSNWDNTDNCREFQSLEEMNDKIINNINDLVMPNDIIINLGDIAFGDKRTLIGLLDRINCKNHHYIIGNHDHWMIDTNSGEFKSEVSELFSSMQFYLEIFAGKTRICFNHFASRVWHDSHKGAILCYGHSHNSLPSFGKSLDVGVDCYSYFPQRLSDIVEWANTQEIVKVDHH